MESISCSTQGSNCCFLTHIEFSQETGKMAWYSHLFKNFPQLLWSTQSKSFSIVNATQVVVFLEFPWFLNDPVNVGNLNSGSSSFSKPNLDIWKFLVHIMLKPSTQDFKHDLTSKGDGCNCPMVSILFSTTLLGNRDEDWPFPVSALYPATIP